MKQAYVWKGLIVKWKTIFLKKLHENIFYTD